MVLEPDLDLGGRQVEHGCQVFTLWGAEVALLPEATLQLICLSLAEQHPPLLFLGREATSAITRLVLALILIVLIVVKVLLYIILIHSMNNLIIKDLSPLGLELMTSSIEVQDLVSEPLGH